MATLFELTDQMVAIEQTLDENGGELTPELEQVWEETKESLISKVDNYNSLIKVLDYRSKNIDTEIKRLQSLKKTYDNSLKRVKEHIKDVMVAYDIPKLDGNYCKISLTTSTATEVDEETLLTPFNTARRVNGIRKRYKIPAWINIEFSVNKSILKETFKDKDVTPAGVSFVKNTSLRIR